MWNVGVWRSVEIHKILCSDNNPSCEWQFTWTEEEFREIHGILHFSALPLYLQDLAKTVFVCGRFCEGQKLADGTFMKFLKFLKFCGSEVAPCFIVHPVHIPAHLCHVDHHD